MSKKSYWLLKSEPETRIVRGRDVKFSIDDLKVMRISHWDGVVIEVL
jgi:predicted RNA-binding protein with PUA-like domain